MSSEELGANLFRATQTEAKLKRELEEGRAIGQDVASTIHHDVGKKVRQTIQELGGTMPEELPLAEHIREVEKRLKEKGETDVTEETIQQTKAMMKMMRMKFNNQIKFETKIKSIKGKHDWIKQIDDYTIDMSFSFDDLFDENITLKNADSKIEIITE